MLMIWIERGQEILIGDDIKLIFQQTKCPNGRPNAVLCFETTSAVPILRQELYERRSETLATSRAAAVSVNDDPGRSSHLIIRRYEGEKVVIGPRAEITVEVSRVLGRRSPRYRRPAIRPDSAPQERAADLGAVMSQIFQPALIPEPPPPFEWKDLPLKKCQKCNCRTMFGLNIDTAKSGPLDARPTIYVMRRQDAGVEPRRVQTFRNFMATVKRIELADGTVLGPDDLCAFASHFNTCPAADYFSKRSKRK